MSFVFAVIGVFFLVCIGISLSYRQTWLALLFVIVATAHIGFGFVVKARAQRNNP